ncbi:hypothetical protein AB6A23_12850 [Paenibacillus tarimensis]
MSQPRGKAKRSRQGIVMKKQQAIRSAPFEVALFRVVESNRVRSSRMAARDRLFVLKIVGNVLRGTGRGLHVMAAGERPHVSHEHVVMGSAGRIQRLRTNQGTGVRQTAFCTTLGAHQNRSRGETQPLPLQLRKSAPGQPWVVTNPNNGVRAVEITPTRTTLKLALGFRA